ncbi:hypothetical protein TNCV_830161 [Trichonephila clavipes]|nr:hypothetical protein TNCV_830161 [Trichonephila clavipes]
MLDEDNTANVRWCELLYPSCHLLEDHDANADLSQVTHLKIFDKYFITKELLLLRLGIVPNIFEDSNVVNVECNETRFTRKNEKQIYF